AKVKAVAGSAKGTVKVSWKADKAATGGFKVFVYAKKGGKLVKTKVVKSGATSATVKGLKSGKKYYVRVSPYLKKSGTTYPGAVSGWKTVKAK
ncbi:MAG: fibronectin type III domain-containing protein, partial [Atopobiaceae bacterium]|nr:fibronectin type III domain-containing protein [Atopobiaceae bacterium]